MARQDATPTGDGEVAPLRIKRGAEVFTTDGALGTVEQVVMNQRSHELQAIVVRPLGSEKEMLIGVSHVARAGENQVHLDFGRAAMASNPKLAQPYNPEWYVPVSPDASIPREQAARIAGERDQPVVSGLEPDAVEVMAPADQVQSPPRIPPERMTADWHVPGSIASVAPQTMEPKQTMETETTPMKKTSDQSLRTPETPSAQQEAQQVAYNPESAAYPAGIPRLATPAGALPHWVIPVALGAGASTVIAGAAFGTLAWRRRAQPAGLDWWRTQLKLMTRDPRKATRNITRSTRRAMKIVAPELAGVGALAADQADAWRAMLGEQLGAWQESVGGPAMNNAKQISRIISKRAPKGLAGWTAALATVAALTDKQLDAWRGTLSHQLDDWRGTASDALNSNSRSLSKTLARSARRVSRAPHRVVTRAMLNMRWFRRGIFFGAIGGAILGLLFAPIPGNKLRTQLRDLARQFGGQVQATVSTAQVNLPQRATGATGTTPTPGTTKPAKSTGTQPTGTKLSETGPIR